MPMPTRPATAQAGFTLLELMIVVAIIAILALIAVPMYGDYIRKSRRADALQRMQQIALAQERFRAENPGYTSTWATLGGDPDVTNPTALGEWFDWSDVTVDNTATPPTYTITVTAVDAQEKDKADGVSCTSLTVDQAGTRTAAECWAI